MVQLVIQEPGKRAVDSYFGEILLPVFAGVELNAAVRSDDYDDVGSNDSFKVGVLLGKGNRGTMVKFKLEKVSELQQWIRYMELQPLVRILQLTS
ncbi:MAG: hypothetical protein Ct9H300mP20_12400 [Gammaproteobacteria bacterium]|nr:MAG: hypothetical protein Ct9H300mP20_12400 [Gammaproteobacteria bacterium]